LARQKQGKIFLQKPTASEVKRNEDLADY
jgi:hypothetical protein